MLSRSVTVWTQTTWPSSALGFISSPEWCLCLLRLFALPVSRLVTSWCNTWTTDSDFLRTCVEYLSTRKCYITFVFTLIHFHWMHPCLARFFDYDAGVKFQSNSKCQQLYYPGTAMRERMDCVQSVNCHYVDEWSCRFRSYWSLFSCPKNLPPWYTQWGTRTIFEFVHPANTCDFPR